MPPSSLGEPFSPELKAREEAKRAVVEDPIARWKAIQEFLDWAAAQPTAPKNTPAARKAKERRPLAGIAGMLPTQVGGR